MAIAVEKTWLMDHQVLRLVNRCRRLIQVEFGFKPPLDDKALRQVLADCAGSTRQPALQHYYAELRTALIDMEGPDEPETPASVVAEPTRRMYRGRPVAEPPAADGPATDAVDDASGKAGVIYRGRKVGGG